MCFVLPACVGTPTTPENENDPTRKYFSHVINSTNVRFRHFSYAMLPTIMQALKSMPKRAIWDKILAICYKYKEYN